MNALIEMHHAFLDAVEPVVSEALEEDPYAGVADAAGYFDSLRDRVSERVASVRLQALASQPAAAVTRVEEAPV